jgi:DNA repair ATPase RecN
MINLLKIAQKLDKKGQYKAADKLTKSASILLMAIQLKQDLEDGIRALYNYFDERTLNKLLKETNILEQNGDISARPYDYFDFTQKITNLEPISPPDMPTVSGNNNYSNLEEVKQKLLKTVEIIDKFQISIANAHDVQREQQKKLQDLQGDTIPDE